MRDIKQIGVYLVAISIFLIWWLLNFFSVFYVLYILSLQKQFDLCSVSASNLNILSILVMIFSLVISLDIVAVPFGVNKKHFKLSLSVSILLTFASLIWFIVFESIKFKTHCDYANICLWAIISAPVLLLILNSIVLLIRYLIIRHKWYKEIDYLNDFEERQVPIQKANKKLKMK